MEAEFRSMTKDDWVPVAEIFRQGIETGVATFDTEVPTWDMWDAAHLKNCRLVAVCDNAIIAWAALVPVSGRKVYSGVAEVSIYVSNNFRGLGIGTRLLEKLIAESEKEGFWTLQAVILPENKASIRVHQNLGFREVGFREKIGNFKGTWRDTVLLERRSRITGV